MKTHINICYKCGAPATTREHVPPLCLFPEIKDINGDFRRNLITVPSCEKHNLSKTKEDEFLLISIASFIGNNEIGYYHSRTKVARALARKGIAFFEQVILRNIKYYLFDTGYKKIPIFEGDPDFIRLNNCFEHIALGLFFFKFNKVFHGKIKVILGFLNYHENNMITFIKFVRERFLLEVLGESEQGENSQVFKFQFSNPDKWGLLALKMVFYEGAEVYISFQPNGTDIPFDISQFLIDKGVKTIVTLPGKEFIFNGE